MSNTLGTGPSGDPGQGQDGLGMVDRIEPDHFVVSL